MTAQDYQLDFNGTVIGDGTPWEVVEWGGLEEFTTRGSDVVAPQLWGALSGSSYVDPRVVTVVVESVNPVDVVLLEAALLPPGQASPDRLVSIRWKFPNREELKANGRCARRSRARDITTGLGLTRVVVELEFPDPRAYAASPSQASLTVFIAGTSGFDLTVGAGADRGFELAVDSGVNLGFDLVGVSASGLATLVNSGTVDTYPTFTFTGIGSGLQQWSVTNLTTGQTSTWVQQVNPGEQLIADMGSVATGSPGLPVSLSGVSRYGSWQPPRTPFRLQPGANLCRFDVASGDAASASLVVWSNAYL
jgi:hypothetical protein